ncbi:MAG: DUF420 domain-containing protein [Deltaproteobacteria bacterium]|nr:DUF420 domain-containing protein [Deltaproteobacteria bacterium]
MAASGAAWEQLHPAINAMLNGSSTIFLFAGYVAVKKGNTELHWRSMLAAFIASSVFLASYLVRFYLSGTHKYPGTGADKIAYLVILFSHMLLAMVAVPMILRLLWLARTKEFDKHRKLARWTWPIWMYVSVTGVVVYLMLYPVADALYGP